jgi:hypothetical protein
MYHVMVPDIDHLDPVMPALRGFDRVRFTQTLLTMLLHRILPIAKSAEKR